jgi:hypothetical protein
MSLRSAVFRPPPRPSSEPGCFKTLSIVLLGMLFALSVVCFYYADQDADQYDTSVYVTSGIIFFIFFFVGGVAFLVNIINTKKQPGIHTEHTELQCFF